jgi:hypothetical protein
LRRRWRARRRREKGSISWLKWGESNLCDCREVRKIVFNSYLLPVVGKLLL